MKRTLALLLVSIVLLGACRRTNYTVYVAPTDQGKTFIKGLNERKVFAASTITYGTSGSVSSRDTLSIYPLNDSVISFRNDSLFYTAYSYDSVYQKLTLSLSQWDQTAGGNLKTATFTYYTANDSVSYFYSIKNGPLFTTGYEVSMHSL